MPNDATISRFNKGSEHYRTASIKYRKLSADRVSQLVAPAATDIILDIGCGTGTQLIELAGKIHHGIGIDISAGMVQKAKDQLKNAGITNLEFHEGDFITPEKEIPLDKLKINKVISNYALHHLNLTDKKRALEKMIDLGGDTLEMILIGDLMFFDDPEKYRDQYDQVGYNPENDQPCYADELASLLDGSGLTIVLNKLHPLVGVLQATRMIKS